MEESAKRNAPHIHRVNLIKGRIETLIKEVNEKEITEETLILIRNTINNNITDIKGTYNNREMAIVVSKLQEAGHWIAVDNPSKHEFQIASDRLREANNWASEYIKTLQ